MKKFIPTLVVLSFLATAALFAQSAHPAPGRPGLPPPNGHRLSPPPPVMLVLDTNHDGELSADEIANASVALLVLDQNGDGQLAHEELCPPPPPLQN